MKIISAAVLPLLFFALILMGGCSQDSPSDETSYRKISSKDALDLMNQNDSVILVDVRTVEEFAEGHIEGAILIPDFEIEKSADELLKDKSATIILYCRSGNRSASAANKLVQMGYTSVFDLGGIIDWEYETVIPD